MSFFNKFASIAIGGPNINTVPTPYGVASLDVCGNAVFRNNVEVVGNFTFAGATIAYDNLDISGNLTIGGNADISGNLTIDGSANFNILSTTGLANFIDIDVSNNTTLNTLTTEGLASLESLDVSNNATFNTLTTNSLATLESLDVINNTNLNNLTVTGLTALQGALDGQLSSMNITTGGNTILESNDYMTLTSNNDLVINTDSSGVGSIYFQVNGTGNLDFLTTSGVTTFNSYDEATFRSQVGAINFATVTSGDINFNPASTYNINLTTEGAGADININSRQNLGLITEFGDIDITTTNGGDISLTAANNRHINLTTSGLGDVTIIGGQHTFVRANNGILGLRGTDFINFENQVYFNRVPTLAEYTTNNKAIGYTSSINTGTAYTGTASDTTTPAQVGTFTLPARGVWLIQFDCQLTLNTGSDTITNREIVLSETSASLTPAAPAFHMRDPIDDSAGSSGARQVYSFSGVYHLTAAATKALFINVIGQTSGSRTVTASGNYKFTRIA